MPMNEDELLAVLQKQEPRAKWTVTTEQEFERENLYIKWQYDFAKRQYGGMHCFRNSYLANARQANFMVQAVVTEAQKVIASLHAQEPTLAA
jgi:hypothetical protein